MHTWKTLWIIIVLMNLAQTFILPCAWASSDKVFETFDERMRRFKHPTPWLEIGVDFRFRIVYDEARKLDRKAKGHDRLNQRYRGRVWSKIKQSDDLNFEIRLVTEPRYFHRPDLPKQLTRHEVLFDRLNLKWSNVFNLPVTATVGRQNMRMGTGWLLLDGTPLDGGRTNFFDGIRLTYDFEQQDTTADLIWLNNHADSAKWIKPFNDRDFDLAEQDEQGAILYLSNTPSKDGKFDYYFIYKHNRNRNKSSGSEGNIYTFGTMIDGKINDNWGYCFEVAPQFGHKNSKELNAFATNNRLTYNFNDSSKNRIHLGYEYLSGDDDPERNFDKIFGRNDQWSVLYNGSIDSLDGRKIDSSNLHRFNVGWTTEPTEKTEFRVDYNLLFADDNTSSGGTGGLSKNGNFRGQLVRAELRYKVNTHVKHRLEAELFLPGGFYNNDRNDVAVFFRYGIVLTW